MEGLMRKSSKLVGLAGAVLALSLLAGCSSNEPDPAQRAVNAANQADQAAARADAAAQKSAAAAAQAQAAASRVEQAASDAKAAADRAEAIASKTMSEHHEHRASIVATGRRPMQAQRLAQQLAARRRSGGGAAGAAAWRDGSSARSGSCDSVISLRLDNHEGGCIGSRPRLTLSRSLAGLITQLRLQLC